MALLATARSFPIAAFLVLCLIDGAAVIMAICFWCRLGPSGWYGESANAANTYIWNNAAAMMPSIATSFSGLIIAVIFTNLGRSTGMGVLKDIGTTGEVLGLALFAFGSLAMFSIFFTSRPQMFVPPPFRRRLSPSSTRNPKQFVNMPTAP